MSQDRPRISAVIPAFNEESRIRPVLEAIVASGAADEIIVVDDGSSDHTADVAQSVAGVRTIQLPRNRGKAYALQLGAEAASNEVLLFLDADLIGLKPHQICSLVEPVVSDRAGLALGIFGGGRFWTDLAQRIAPNISGQRALRRDLFLSVPDLEDCRFGVEVATSGYVRACGLRIERVSFAGVTHPTKEEKLGFFRGEWERLKMYVQIASYKLRHLRRLRRLSSQRRSRHPAKRS